MYGMHFDTILKTTLTVAGRSQHLSRLIQLKLQIISNIWSWNCAREGDIYQDSIHKENAQQSPWDDWKHTGLCETAATVKTTFLLFWMRFVLESGGMPFQMYAFIFTYCCRLPPSTSRLDHLAKHFVAVQRDVVGCFNGFLCHLMTVQIYLDFVWRDRDVELWGTEQGST